jgi:hypothetical protein
MFKSHKNSLAPSRGICVGLAATLVFYCLATVLILVLLHIVGR